MGKVRPGIPNTSCFWPPIHQPDFIYSQVTCFGAFTNSYIVFNTVQYTILEDNTAK